MLVGTDVFLIVSDGNAFVSTKTSSFILLLIIETTNFVGNFIAHVFT